MKRKLFSFLILVLSTNMLTFAQIKITTIAGLQAMENDKSYILDADIDLSTLIGGLNKDLTNVTLDGNYFTLKNLTADGGSRGGLFKNISGCTIKNLKIKDFTIGGDWAGAIAGHADNSTITRCTATGIDVQATGIGGGLIGHMEKTLITECAVRGAVTGRDHVGGIAGHMQNVSTIENCFVDGDIVTTNWQVGGIVGWSEGATDKINNCFAAGTVSAGVGFTGGIIGAGVGGGVKVSNCVAIQSKLKANSDIPKTNRIVGDHGATTLEHNYGFVDMTWEDPKRTETWTSLPNGKDGVSVTLAQVATPKFYTDSLPTWDFNNVWIMDTNRPKLRMENGPVAPAAIKITTIAGLQAMENDKSYILDADIDLTTLTGGLNKDLTNVTLDGNYFTLKNLTADGGSRGGLFKNISGCTIKNLKIKDFTIGGDWAGAIAGHADNSTITRCTATGIDVQATGIGGGLIGHMEKTLITECAVRGAVTGRDHVGGIAGHMQNVSTIENCFVDGDIVTTNWQVGGIVGWSEGTTDKINNCFAAGTVSAGVGFTGGIIGAGVGGGVKVSNCVAIQSKLKANSDIPKTNRIVGDHGATTLEHNYGFVDMTWEDPKRTETWTSLPNGKDGVSVTLAQVATPKFYTDSLPTWDFNNVWIMDTNRPKLRMENGPVSGVNQVKTAFSKVMNIDGKIAVECPINSVITVYNTLGTMVEQRKSVSAKELFSQKGILIIRVVSSQAKELFKVIN